MRTAIKIAFATVLAAILLASPIGACASTKTPAHPCCPAKPAPLPDDCARPGCIYMDTHIAPTAIATANDAGPVYDAPIAAAPANLRIAETRAIPMTARASRRRFVAIHQFLI